MKSILVLGMTLLGSGSVFAIGLDKEAADEFYKKVLSCDPVSLPCLKEQSLLKPLGPNLYALNSGADIGYPDEIISGDRISTALGLPILLLPNLPGLQSVPAFDAVVFSMDGHPLANLSIKSFRGDSINPMNALKSRIIEARASLKEIYSHDYLPKRFGFSVAAYGELLPNKGTRDQEIRKQILTGARVLSGLKPDQTRPLWFSVDFIEDQFRSFSVVRGGEGEIPFDGNFLRVWDKREGRDISRPKVLHLETLIERAHINNDISRYLVLIRNSIFSLDKDGFEISEGCESLLKARPL